MILKKETPVKKEDENKTELEEDVAVDSEATEVLQNLSHTSDTGLHDTKTLQGMMKVMIEETGLILKKKPEMTLRMMMMKRLKQDTSCMKRLKVLLEEEKMKEAEEEEEDWNPRLSFQREMRGHNRSVQCLLHRLQQEVLQPNNTGGKKYRQVVIFGRYRFPDDEQCSEATEMPLDWKTLPDMHNDWDKKLKQRGRDDA